MLFAAVAVHVPGLIWAAGFFVAAAVTRALPEPPPPRHVVDKYLHIPSTFPTRLANQGMHRPQTQDLSGMTPGMQPYGPAGAIPRQGNMRGMSRSLAIWGGLCLLLAFGGAA